MATVQSGRDAVAAIDVATRRVVARFPVGTDPEQFGVTPDGRRVYVAHGGTSTVSVVDARTLRVVGRVRVGRRPWGIAVGR